MRRTAPSRLALRWWWSHVAEDELHALGPIVGGLDEQPQGVSQLLQPRIRFENTRCCTRPRHPIEIGRQGETTPSHFEESLIQHITCARHAGIVSHATQGACGGCKKGGVPAEN